MILSSSIKLLGRPGFTKASRIFAGDFMGNIADRRCKARKRSIYRTMPKQWCWRVLPFRMRCALLGVAYRLSLPKSCPELYRTNTEAYARAGAVLLLVASGTIL